MRLTDDRYAAERSQFELALRMIRHEARTRTIRECTGLSDDRIRKLYSTYFRNTGANDIRRRRGKSPRQITRFVKNPENQLQATMLVALYCSGLLLRIDSSNNVSPCWPRPDVEFGHRVCRAYETYLLLHDEAELSFEWAWSLLQNISHNDELYLAICSSCLSRYVQDAYALDHKSCPSCEIEMHRRRRPGAHSFAGG
ncbi:MAG: flagellar transcriptional regulator FlhC [Gammaproteobacteria bacterium]|nr:flagellar transcriptional regulator FlhC [Gammaproteobacteria bacterium]MDH3431293.1 flagellar transcriptional regulator FlhC [Gammaproteobacteria bacterium]MDH3434172.1 flagellar transcriptional regulator FlhC [Gammaproteobacteria bacterium]